MKPVIVLAILALLAQLLELIQEESSVRVLPARIKISLTVAPPKENVILSNALLSFSSAIMQATFSVRVLLAIQPISCYVASKRAIATPTLAPKSMFTRLTPLSHFVTIGSARRRTQILAAISEQCAMRIYVLQTMF